MPSHKGIEKLAEELLLGGMLEALKLGWGGYDLLDHWTQGEFHHDLVLRVRERHDLPGDVIVIATNCNGGVKELLCFNEPPDRWALWHYRCPENEEFDGTLAPILAEQRTVHWFDPCELLAADARSELKPTHRRRQRGGGWEQA